MSQRCVLCHNASGPAKGTRMVLKPSTEAGFLQANFETVKKVAAIDVGGKPLFLLKPSGQHPDGHGGGKIFAPDSPTYNDFSTFVGRVTKGQGCGSTTPVGCTADGTGARVLRRLTRSEYDATIHDLFGIDSTYGTKFAADAIVNGFDNTAAQLAVSPLLADELREASEDIATKFMANPGSRLPCSAQSGDATCASTFIDTFGKRAFRRPLTASEADRYKKLYAAFESKGFATALKLVISAMLQSPNFVYRTELGGVAKAEDKSIKLTPYEIASELSYFIWGTMPDETLLAAADSGAIATPAELEKQAKRLLADPKSDVIIMRFFEQWLDLNQIAIIPKDAATYPEFTDATRKALLEETRRFVDYVVRQGSGSLEELLTATYSFVSPELAKFYGLPAPSGNGFAKVDVSNQGRAGLLSMGGVIATHSTPNQASPIKRGQLVRERLLCGTLPPPPAGVNTTPPAIDPTKPTRDRFEAHKTQPLCASCHNLMDPIGFSFGHFDGIGRYQALENGPRDRRDGRDRLDAAHEREVRRQRRAREPPGEEPGRPGVLHQRVDPLRLRPRRRRGGLMRE